MNKVENRQVHRHDFGRRVHVRPTTSLGRWSTRLAGLSVAALVVMNVVVASGQRGGDTFSDNWWIAAPAFLALASVVAALVTGIAAVVRDKERSVPVVATLVVGGLVVLFVLGELVVPH